MDLSKISGGIWVMGSCSCWLRILVYILRTKMSDDGDHGGGDSGGGGCDSGAPDSPDHRDSCCYDNPCDPSQNGEDCHSNGQGSNDDAGNINSKTSTWKDKNSSGTNSQTNKAGKQQGDCYCYCCTLM